jgi:hypothetical protein
MAHFLKTIGRLDQPAICKVALSRHLHIINGKQLQVKCQGQAASKIAINSGVYWVSRTMVYKKTQDLSGMCI